MSEPLYGLWNRSAGRWAHVYYPKRLQQKYNHPNNPTIPLFASKEDLQQFLDQTGFSFPIMAKDDAASAILDFQALVEQKRLQEEDKRRRQAHAEKYL